MKKARATKKAKPKAKAKKGLRKPVKKPSRALSTVARKAKGLTKARKKKATQRARKKTSNVISIAELYEQKKKMANAQKAESTFPPHQPLDQAVHERKPQAHTKLRSGMQGLRHK